MCAHAARYAARVLIYRIMSSVTVELSFPVRFVGRSYQVLMEFKSMRKPYTGKNKLASFVHSRQQQRRKSWLTWRPPAHPELDKFPCEFHGCPYKATSRQHLGYHLEVCKFAKRSPDLRVKGVREEQITLVKALFKDTSFDKTLNRVRLTHREVKQLDPSHPKAAQKYLCDTVMDFYQAMLQNDTHEVQFSYLPAYFFGFLC